MTKVCTKCQVVKPKSEFSKHKRKTDGLQSQCKLCDTAYEKENRARIAARKAAHYLANVDKNREKNSARYLANRERELGYFALYRAKNRSEVNRRVREWRAKNPSMAKAAVAAWVAANPETMRVIRQNRRARKAGGKLSKNLSIKLFALQRGKCACGCGKPLGDDFHLDHRMPLALGGTNTDDNMQLLTATCNLQKGAKHPVDFMQQRGFLL